MQPDLQQWLEKSSSDQERPQLTPPTIKNTITVEVEIHQHPVEATLDDDDGNNRDAIDIALDIAKDASTVKNDIRRIEKIIVNTQNTQARENRTLLLLLNSIQKTWKKSIRKQILLKEKLIIYLLKSIYRNKGSVGQHKPLNSYSNLCQT